MIAYRKPELSPEGTNRFLTGDKSVKSATAEEAKAIIEDLNAGKNPPPSLEKKA